METIKTITSITKWEHHYLLMLDCIYYLEIYATPASSPRVLDLPCGFPVHVLLQSDAPGSRLHTASAAGHSPRNRWISPLSTSPPPFSPRKLLLSSDFNARGHIYKTMRDF